jgi:hypothetical protein
MAAHHKRVTVVINLLHIVKRYASPNVRYMYLTFNVNLCQNHGITAYKQIHEVQSCQFVCTGDVYDCFYVVLVRAIQLRLVISPWKSL